MWHLKLTWMQRAACCSLRNLDRAWNMRTAVCSLIAAAVRRLKRRLYMRWSTRAERLPGQQSFVTPLPTCTSTYSIFPSREKGCKGAKSYSPVSCLSSLMCWASPAICQLPRRRHIRCWCIRPARVLTRPEGKEAAPSQGGAAPGGDDAKGGCLPSPLRSLPPPIFASAKETAHQCLQ